MTLKGTRRAGGVAEDVPLRVGEGADEGGDLSSATTTRTSQRSARKCRWSRRTAPREVGVGGFWRLASRSSSSPSQACSSIARRRKCTATKEGLPERLDSFTAAALLREVGERPDLTPLLRAEWIKTWRRSNTITSRAEQTGNPRRTCRS